MTCEEFKNVVNEAVSIVVGNMNESCCEAEVVGGQYDDNKLNFTHFAVNKYTNLIVDGSYKMDNETQYESWKDGNYVEHRSGRHTKLNGSFDVCLSPKTGTTLSQFHSLVENATGSAGTIICSGYSTSSRGSD